MQSDTDTPTRPHADTRSSAAEPLTIYRANMRHDLSFIQTLVLMGRNVWGARELIRQLMWRDLTAQYKKSYIGALWILAGPIMAVVPWLFAAKVNVYNPGDITIPLAVYLVVGRSCWSVFNGFYTGGATTLGQGTALVMQVNYPHEALFIKQILAGLVNFSLSFVTTIVVMLVSGVYPGWGSLLFPLTLLPLFFLGAAMGLLVAMIRIVAYDLDRIITIIMSLLMWTTPLLYSDTNPPSQILRTINEYNPLTYLVCSCREVLIHGRLYNDAVGVYFACAGVAFLFFVISLRLFYVSEHKLVERML